MFNTKTQKRLQEAITPYLKKKTDWKNNLERKVWEILTTNKAVHTLVSEIKGHVKLKNKEEKDYLILWLKQGEERIHVYEDKLMRSEAWKEILNSKYQRRITYLDFQKLYKLKILIDIRYEDAKPVKKNPRRSPLPPFIKEKREDRGLSVKKVLN